MASKARASRRHLSLVLECLVACTVTGLLLASQCAPPPGDPVGNGTTDTPSAEKTLVTIDTNLGRVVMELFPKQSPDCVSNFVKYVDEGYYDGSIVDEVAENGSGMIAGSFDVDFKLREEKPLANESNNGLRNIRGAVALFGPTAQTISQPAFLINLAANTDLDFVLATGQKTAYTVIGKIVSGMDILDQVATFETITGTSDDGTELSGIPVTEDGFKVRIIKMTSQTIEDPVNQPPVADAGADQTVDPAASITLHGGGNDPDNDPFAYKWELTAESEKTLQDANLTVPTLDSDTAKEPTLTGPKPSTPIDLVFRLTITDDRGESREDTTTVTVNSNSKPVANAGADQTGQPGTAVAVDGSASKDPESADTLTYAWAISPESSQLLTSQGLAVPPAGASQKYSFTAPPVAVPTVLTFSLTVTDDKGASTNDTVQARILPFTFAPAVSYPAGGGSTLSGLAVAQFGADGRPDAAVADSANNRVLVYLNDGSGGLGTPAAYAIGASPTSIVAADFDSDGDQDLAVATSSDNKLYVLLNDGTGQFTVQPRSYNLGPSPASLIAVDLDSKNGPDVVAVNVGDNKLSVWFNSGDGIFDIGTIAQDISVKKADNTTVTTTGARVVAAAKLDSDGNPDLVTVFASTRNAAILINQPGDNSFTSSNAYDVASTDPAMILLSDVDKDTRPDSVIVMRDLNKMSVRLGSTSGTFGLEATYDTGTGPAAVAVADVDADSKPDLVVANETANTVSILQNKGGGSFKTKFDLTLAIGDTGPTAVAAVDLDGDGSNDLVVANRTSGTVSVFLSQTTPSNAPVDAQGFTTTASWLKYKDITTGSGPLVQPTSTVVARYTGRLNDETGPIFDTTVGTADETTGREFGLDSVITGWKEGLGSYDMRVGGKRQLLIPPDLGYGATGSGEKIPPHALLWFEVEVLQVK